MTADDDVAESYARGRVTFMGLELAVAPGALVPRAETELLGETAVQTLRAMSVPAPRVIDVCCGAGNLACAIAHRVPEALIWASDVTASCVELTRTNVGLSGVSDRASVLQGDLFSAFSGLDLEGTIDLIVCNPPYISEKRLHGDRAHLLELEPREAFAAGPFGLAIHMRAVKEALPFLRPGGVLAFEVGAGQDRQVKILFDRTRAYDRVRTVVDEAGEGRVVLGERK